MSRIGSGASMRPRKTPAENLCSPPTALRPRAGFNEAAENTRGKLEQNIHRINGTDMLQ